MPKKKSKKNGKVKANGLLIRGCYKIIYNYGSP
jgi:hypothetical protein